MRVPFVHPKVPRGLSDTLGERKAQGRLFVESVPTDFRHLPHRRI